MLLVCGLSVRTRALPVNHLHLPCSFQTWHLLVWQVHPGHVCVCRKQGVTVSHAYCPCASSSNLFIAPHHALCVLHKMCISGTALPPAHVERTCRLA